LRIEGEEDPSNILLAEDKLRIKSDDEIIIYTPLAVRKIYINGGSSLIDIANCYNDVIINSGDGNVTMRELYGQIRANSVAGSIALEDCRGDNIWLESESGDITVRQVVSVRVEEKIRNNENGGIPGMDIKTGWGKIAVVDADGEINVESVGGDITMEQCRSQNIKAESKGGSLTLRDVANAIELNGENSDIMVEDFFGKINVKAKDTRICIKKSGDAEIHIESDGGDISVEDCYADIYVNSGTGGVNVSGGSLSFGGMGKVDLKMKDGDAYLNRRTFDDIRIDIEKGSAELNMEKISSGGSGKISVYDGDIIAKISPDFPCEVIANGQKKKIHMDLPVEITELAT
jgi:DUF4097 and DUF4098 domain-containing protein YvlB